ncbi:hypothetical protein BFF78_19325 [Streptomyces fodineus]|uniref:YcaO domain-containing protein n=1 Tax=Streptomyces fodineus TaxID=1904616 RepID=A0A1D7YBC4_9ACTN|nr:TOMM precursor leader peptide-binding protein [Streptomyces fodineus]AOR32928.1 hypothetical protein BFF78_19325 [Streptomyces fodineus]
MTSGGRRVGFRRHMRVEVVPGEAAYLLSPQGVSALHGDRVQLLAPLLDGTRTLEEVLRGAGSALPALEAGRLLAELGRADLVAYREAAADAPPEALAYWDLAGLDGDAAATAVATTPVQVIGVGGVDAEQVRAACSDSGLVPAAEGRAAGLSLVVCDDYLDPELADLDAWHRERGRPWLLARPDGAQPWVGPVFTPGSGPCWHCLAHRLRAHRAAELPVQRALESDRPLKRPVAELAAGRALGRHTAALEAAKWLAGARHDGQRSLCVLDTLTLRSTHHPVRARPQCPACGDPGLVAARARRPIPLAPRPKATGTGGNHRSLSPERMLERYRHLVSPITGVVSGITRDERLPEGLNCYLSGRNLALSGTTLDQLRGHLRSSSGGKGTTALEAQVGALCEAVERYSGTRQGDEYVLRDTLTGIGPQALHPNDCQLFAERQFTGREEWNARHSAFHRVPAPFRADRPVEWTPVRSLTTGGERWLPTSLLYFTPAGSRDAAEGPWADSNGNAAGSSLEDAVVQGFLELVERDAVALWWYNRTRQPAVCLDAFDDPWVAGLRESCGRLRRELWVLDLTADFGIPVMAAVSRRTDKPAEDIALGFGAHFDPRLALRRALTEMCQLLPVVARADPDGGGYGTSEPDLLDWWTRRTVADQPYLVPDPGESPRTPGSWAYVPSEDLLQDVRTATALTERHGMDLLVLDQTRPDLGLPVVKVIVPGLRHFWARFGPGRLFDVPVELGRRDRPIRYENLNPVLLFY